jgi:hypothetical protein
MIRLRQFQNLFNTDCQSLMKIKLFTVPTVNSRLRLYYLFSHFGVFVYFILCKKLKWVPFVPNNLRNTYNNHFEIHFLSNLMVK